jgi:hypothetical protein
MHQKLIGVRTKLKTILSNLQSSEVAEALVATWCIEYLRVRRLGGFNVVEIMAISALMLGVKAIVMEANRRKYNGKGRTVVVSRRNTQMGEMEIYPDSSNSRPWHGRHGYRQSNVRQRRSRNRNPYQDL